MSLGVELTAGAFRSIRPDGNSLVLRSCPPQFCVLHDSPAIRQRLDESATHYQICSEGLLVIGQWRDAWVEIAASPPRKLLPYGRVPVGDPISRQLLALALEAIVPEATPRGKLCCLSIPGSLPRETLDDDPNLQHLSHLVALRGWEPHFINPGLALVLAELGAQRLSGLGIAIDEESTQASVVVCGKEIAATAVRHVPSLDLADGTPSQIAAFRQQLIDALDTLRHRLAGTLACALPGPVTMICHGPDTGVPLTELVRGAWDATGWHQPLERMQTPRLPAAAIARGCLIHAELDAADRRKAA